MKVIINPDREHVEQIRQKIQENDGYCPCQIKKNIDTRCMCKSFLEMKEAGWCHCLLYYKEEA